MIESSLRGVGLIGLALLLGCAPRPSSPAPARGPSPARPAPLASARVVPGAVATALDEAAAVPRFLRATTRQPAPAGATAEAAARAHLRRHAAAWRVGPADLAGAELRAVHDPGRGGIVVTLQQRVDGVEVYRGVVKVLMRRDLELVAVSGAPRPLPAAAPRFAGTPAAALAAALGAHLGAAMAPGDLAPLGPAPGGYRRLALTRAAATPAGRVGLARPARVKRVLYPSAGGLVPAWFVELFTAPAAGRGEAFRYVVADADGRVLERRNLTADGWQYRVWADADGRPLDGPQADWTPHPTGTPDGSDPPFVAATLVARDAFNTNPDGQPDPWLPSDATETRGNNVDAYADLSTPDGFSSGDLRAATTAPGVFDRVYDTSAAPASSQDQIMAAVTSLFYVTNWLHDWYYDSGFDEAAGNAQVDNYGRGGLGNDPLHAEAQDFSGTNNSNMTTPADGDSPVMQMMLWSGPDQRGLHVAPPDADLATGAAEFGPQEFDVTAVVALAADGTAPTSDGCQTIGGGVGGAVALVDRGLCTFKQKALNAQAAGAAAVLIVNNQPGAPMAMPDGTPDGTLTIPVLSVSLADGVALKGALQQGPVTAHLTRVVGVARDADLDATVVAHEWGHYLHGRLADCNQPMCGAMSEGWGDFIALSLLLRDGDDLGGSFAVAIYSARAMGDSGYFGIRRAPYSTDFAKNPFTFRHIADDEPLPTTAPLQDTGTTNSEAHSAGEIWAEMLFEAYVALLESTRAPGATRDFAAARRAMTDYVVAGLELTPADATYTEARDAILAAAAAGDAGDEALLAAAFARRGAGSCAESPPRDSADFAGVVESYELKPRVLVGAFTVDDSVRSCDGNGRLDGGERGVLTVEIANQSVVPLAGARLTLSSADAGVWFPAGAGIDLGDLPAFGSTTASVEVGLERSVASMTLFRVDATVSASGACAPEVTGTAAFRANYAEQPAASKTDDMEAVASAWAPQGDLPDRVWSRVEVAPGNHVWRGVDLGRRSDTWLESPPLHASGSERFVVSFRHRYEFERDDGGSGPVYYDGAVVELSTDGGATWQDVSSWVEPGYGGTIDDTTGNPLADRRAYVGRNAAWPEMETVTLDFGPLLAGETVLLRFHVGTDMAAGGTGWDIDDVAVRGVDNAPFTALVDHPTSCPPDDAGSGAGGSDGGRSPSGRDLATCGGCGTGRGPNGAALLAALAAAAALGRRRRRR